MEYLHRVFFRLKKNPNLNFHSKYGKLNIVEISFTNDLLLFSCGDAISVKFMLKAFDSLSKSIGMSVNPSKCKAYYGSGEDNVKEEICNITSFIGGTLPFRYLGIPLTSKKLSNHHCLILVDKIFARVKHWSKHLLSFEGRA